MLNLINYNDTYNVCICMLYMYIYIIKSETKIHSLVIMMTKNSRATYIVPHF